MSSRVVHMPSLSSESPFCVAFTGTKNEAKLAKAELKVTVSKAAAADLGAAEAPVARITPAKDEPNAVMADTHVRMFSSRFS
jgi:hypothetical protein